jgi:hypothetical protein
MPRGNGTADALDVSPRSLARLVRVTRVARPFAVVAILVLASAAVATACSSFGAADQADAGTMPEGGSTDAGSPEAGSTEEEASTVDAGRACVPDGCVNFETQSWPSSWHVQGDAAALVVTKGAATSGAWALDLKFQANEAFLSVDVAHKSKVTVRANIKVLQFGDGEVDLFGISESSAIKTPGFHLVHNSTSLSTLVVELGSGGMQLDLASTFTGYTSVMFEYEPAKNAYSYRVGSEPLQSGSLAGAVSADTMAVTIGASFINGTKNTWHVRYDDVEITTTP